MVTNNYTLGRGKVHVARYDDNGNPTAGYRYIGNTPEFSLNIESETLDHFSSDEGIREKDDSVPLQVNRTGSMVTDNIDPRNVALFFFGEESTVTQATVAINTGSPEQFDVTELGQSFKLGVTTNNPTGYFGIATVGFAITDGTTPLVAGTDYEMDFDNGILTLLDTSTLAIVGATLDVTYSVAATTRSRVISGSEPVECSILYTTKNPKGADCIYFFPYVKLTPNGDYALKGDEWQQIPLSMEILKPSGKEAIYRDGKPAYT